MHSYGISVQTKTSSIPTNKYYGYYITAYCNYTAYTNVTRINKEKEIRPDTIDVVFEENGNWSFNVTWKPPRG
jgi:hypothetical protein